MRRVGLIAASVILAACQPAQPSGSDEGEAQAQACDDLVEECRGGRGARSQGDAFANNDFGIAAVFPRGWWVCPAFSGHNIHGYHTVVGAPTFDCLSGGGDHASAYGVYANWNAAFWSEERLLSQDGSCEPETDFEPLEVAGGLRSSQCLVVNADGSRGLTLRAVAGHQPGVDGEPATPLVDYRFSLASSDQTWERDLALFRQFVEQVVLTPPSLEE